MIARGHVLLLAVTAAVVAAAAPRAGVSADTATCVRMPSAGAEPLWVDYGEGGVPPAVRDVLARPGVTVATSGARLPADYRARGAGTTHFVLKLPALVGSPSAPADPATIEAAADRTYDAAVRSTLCPEPIVTLNELAGPGAPVPWTDNVRTYRANVLSLMRRLDERGAVPVLLVHGNPTWVGEAGAWFREAGNAGHLVYEAYYRAPKIVALGRILGPRRIRLGMRSVVRSLRGVGVPRERIGLMLGFQVAPGTAGREGLQPSRDWFRYVKWNALAARQVATEERLGSIWSWGWGNLSKFAHDPDKPAAACVYLWARNTQLCDGKAAAGEGFDASRVEGAIVIPEPLQCVSVVGKLPRTTVLEHRAYLGQIEPALTATFVRQVLRRASAVSAADIDAAELDVIARTFGGSRAAYLAELERRRATVATARGILEDRIRREQMAALVAPPATLLTWTADLVTAALDTATCRGDLLPGTGDFPTSDRRESGGYPLGQRLPFLLDDRAAPLAPTGAVATIQNGAVVLDWDDTPEEDVVGYEVFRAQFAGGVFAPLTRQPWPRSSWRDGKPILGGIYVVRAVDAAGNRSPRTPHLRAVAAPPPPA